jgi:geranyl-CoA carboxylase alpha subunit
VRVDHALRAGMTIPPDYDPLLAKIVARGSDREEARRRLVRAIEATRVLGLVTNKQFLLRLLESETFTAGETTTDFVERWMREDGAGPGPPPRALPALAALLLSGAAARMTGSGRESARALPWSVTLDDGAAPIEVRSDALGIEVVSSADGEIVYLEDGVRRTAGFARDGDAIWVESERSVASYRVRAGGTRTDAAAGEDGALYAPMAAQVVAVAAAAGDRVEKGAALVTLRAMKLEHRVVAPRASVVREVLVREGDQVAFRQPLVRLEAATAEPAAASAPVSS